MWKAVSSRVIKMRLNNHYAAHGTLTASTKAVTSEQRAAGIDLRVSGLYNSATVAGLVPEAGCTSLFQDTSLLVQSVYCIAVLSADTVETSLYLSNSKSHHTNTQITGQYLLPVC